MKTPLNPGETPDFQSPHRSLMVCESGFTLVVTLMLMILITVIAVGLLTLSTITLRTGNASSAAAIARSNAKLALMLAIGDLQRQAGPDQRVTATADIACASGGTSLAAGSTPANNTSVAVEKIKKGLSVVQPGTRYWTGVWRNNNLTSPGIATPGTEIFTKTPSIIRLQWLVSGNETSPADVTSTFNPAFTPASTTCIVNTSGAVSDSKSSVVLVGAGTVGKPSSTTIKNYVTAPLVNITIPTSGGGESRGRYAWWIGDEGVKAKFNRASTTAANPVASYEKLAHQRAGWEVADGLQNYPTPDNARHALLDRLVTLPEAKILDSTFDTALATTLSPVSLFHSATTDSFGVISDTLQSGLRMDLSAVLAKGLTSTPQASYPNAPVLNANLIPPTVTAASSMKGPKWDLLIDFYKQTQSITGGKLTVKASSKPTELTIAPIIVDLRLLMGVKMEMIDTASYKLNPCGKIAISLANPYPYPLQWTSDMELEIIDETRVSATGGSPTGDPNYLTSRIWDASGRSSFLSASNGPAVFNHAIFVIPKGEIPAGEARAYTMNGQTVRPYGSIAPVRINLASFPSSSPANFSNCIIQKDDTANSGSKLLDVRESWTTSQPTAELRLAGGSSGTNVLRRLERFELDNGFFDNVRRGVSRATVDVMTEPFPLHLYSFQISQPGADYVSVLPAADLLGTRGSTLRSFTDFNLQAVSFGKLITSYNPPPYFMESSDSLGSLPFVAPGGETGSAFTKNLVVTPPAWGRSSAGSVKKNILFSFPKTFVSLAQFQHADLTADNARTSISQQPGNAVGNSYATPFVKRDRTIQTRENYFITPTYSGTADAVTTNFYDLSYLLNAALWDTYFFSTISDKSGYTPLNKSITVVEKPAATSSLIDPVNAAGYLMIDGAFNINSTNKNAWKAVLAGNRFLKHPADGTNPTTDALFPRSLEQTSTNLATPSGVADDCFSGYRRLTNAQIDAVAEEIVKQVRMRGPFISLSHFVNRALIDLTQRNFANNPLSRSGALQSALDNGGANLSPDGTLSGFSNSLVAYADKLMMQDRSGAPAADLWGTQANGTRGTTYSGTNMDYYPVWAYSSRDLNPGAVASILADSSMLTDPTMIPEQGYRSTGIPGWITQADLLQAIGPSITARSDTFRIRTYGEALSPDGKTVLAKAWCEAVVQRKPAYIDPTNPPATRTADATMSNINKVLGRKFQIISFRWLSSNEI